MIEPCDLCTGSTAKLVTYDLSRMCCATRYLFDAPDIRREINLAMLSKHHGPRRTSRCDQTEGD